MADASYEVLQAIVAALKANSTVSGLVGTKVYDRPPEGTSAPTSPYVSMGPTQVIRSDFACLSTKEIFIQVDGWSFGTGLAYSSAEARMVADSVERAIHQKPLTLATNRLVSIEHRNTLVMLDADGATHHAVINFVAYTESA